MALAVRKAAADVGAADPQELAAGLVQATLGLEVDSDAPPTFIVRLEIREGWHINANPASEELLIPTTISGDVGDVVYPRASRFRPSYLEKDLAVYKGEVELRGTVTNRNPTLWLSYQACDERRCLPPVKRPLAVGGPAGSD